MSDSIDKFKKELQANGLRVTKSRVAVYGILEKNGDNFLSPDDIFDKVQASKSLTCDRASVYRILSTLSELGLVKVSHFQGQASKYKIHHHNQDCHQHDCTKSHEHYFKCVGCDSIEPIGECIIDPKIEELEKRGFVPLEHHFEISGYCPKCK